MGPLVSRAHLGRVVDYIDVGVADGATLVRDGRGIEVPDAPGGFFLGPTIFDGVRPEMRIAREEIFGPVLSVMDMVDLDEAMQGINRSGFGNGATIFTQSGAAARHFKREVEAGMVGVNVGVPAAMAFFPFSGWNGSFYGDLHMQGQEGVAFYTRQKVTMTRW
ncbi:MAG TPA: aldehyde dehydrogenase family protein, partial [Dehalococcoidia bacterium]|nr:aldehyde dehydrogenase family protein [Dehalococcoidia bacterium]